MSQGNLKFGELEKKIEFNFPIRAITTGDVDIEKMIISDEFSWAKKSSKYLAGYKNNG